MSETTLSTPSTITPLQAMFHEAYSWLENVKFPAPNGSYLGYTGANYKLELGTGRNVLALNVAASAWGSTFSAYDFGTTGSVAGTSNTTYLADNTYNDNTNDKAKTTGLGVRVKLSGGILKIQLAASVSAGATQTWTDAVQTDTTGNLFVGNNTSANPGVALNPTGSATIGNAAGSSGFTFLNILRSGTPIGSITQSGTNAVLYNTSSDRRLKENIRDFALDAWRMLRGAMPKTYEWRSDGETGHGYIAQVLHRFFPSAVTVGHSRSKKPWQVDASKVVPVLHVAIVDVDDRTRAMEKRLAKLEAALAKAR